MKSYLNFDNIRKSCDNFLMSVRLSVKKMELTPFQFSFDLSYIMNNCLINIGLLYKYISGLHTKKRTRTNLDK